MRQILSSCVICPIPPTRSFNTFKKTTKANGFLSLEAGLVLLVVALAIVSAVMYYRDNLRKTSVNNNVNQILATAGAARSVFGQANQYAQVTTAIAVSANIIPSALRNGTTQSASNNFGGEISVSPANLSGTSDGLKISWPNVPSNQCIEIIMGVHAELRKLQVAGNDVKALDSPLSIANLSTQCEASSHLVLDLFVGRT